MEQSPKSRSKLSAAAIIAITGATMAMHGHSMGAPILRHIRREALPTGIAVYKFKRPKKHSVRVALRHNKKRVVGGRFALHEKNRELKREARMLDNAGLVGRGG